MSLRLTLSGGTAGRDTRTLATGTLSIGRGERNDWVLPDPDRHLSKTHCVISVEDGRYVLTDLSTNGLYMNGARQPTTRDSRVVLTDGDAFQLGDYSILAETVAGGPAPAPAASRDADPLDIDPLDDPLGRPPDPSFSHPVHQSAPPRRTADPFDEQDEARRRPVDPNDDLFAGVKPAVSWDGPSQPDHADAPRHALPAMHVLPPANPNEIDFDALIGDLSLPEPPPARATPGRAPDPAAAAVRPPLADPFAALDDLLSPMSAKPAAALPQPAPAAPVAPPPSPSPGSDPMKAALIAFLEGAGVPDAPGGEDAEATLRHIGSVFRALTDGLREVLMSRAAIKGELRVEQTLLKSTNNNALKFSFSPEEAMIALLSNGRRGYMPPLAAAREAFDDIKMHELAVMAGVQTALLTLLRRFDPDTLETRLTQGLLSNVLPGARKARLWDTFRDTYKTIASEAEDDFQAVFGRAFAKAYAAQSHRKE